MNINLSENEIQVIITALRDWMQSGPAIRGDNPGLQALLDDRTWLHRQDAAADLVHKLESERESPEPAQSRKSRPVALCGNDPVEW